MKVCRVKNIMIDIIFCFSFNSKKAGRKKLVVGVHKAVSRHKFSFLSNKKIQDLKEHKTEEKNF